MESKKKIFYLSTSSKETEIVVKLFSDKLLETFNTKKKLFGALNNAEPFNKKIILLSGITLKTSEQLKEFIEEIKTDDNKSDKNICIYINHNLTNEQVNKFLKHGISNYINFKEINELKNIVQIYLKSLVLQKNEKHIRLKRLFNLKQEFILTNTDILKSKKINSILDSILYPTQIYTKNIDINGLYISIYELLVNACEHGNLGITSYEKETALSKGNYNKLLKYKLTNIKDKNKNYVFLKYYINSRRILVVIKDNGDGFDKKRYLKNTEKKVNFFSGRGISIARHYFDKVKYNKKGNVVKCYKYYKKKKKVDNEI